MFLDKMPRKINIYPVDINSPLIFKSEIDQLVITKFGRLYYNNRRFKDIVKIFNLKKLYKKENARVVIINNECKVLLLK